MMEMIESLQAERSKLNEGNEERGRKLEELIERKLDLEQELAMKVSVIILFVLPFKRIIYL